ncbi:MAG: M1 family metallopeptidase [Bacteroidia bacterium]
MKNALCFLLLLPFAGLFAQSGSKAIRQANWQQQVNHTISVRLDDTAHMLYASEQVEYVNNSPDALNEIWFHVYANAYRDNQSALAKQQINGFQPGIFYAKKDARGGYEKLIFRLDGVNLAWEAHPEHADIVKLVLPKALPAGSSLKLDIDFNVRIPEQFSRFGHDSSGYQITQWFPKPAVYDVNGWNIFPYLDQGEFYYEYGRYDVRITTPSSYVVAATGVLQDSGMRKRMETLAEGEDWKAEGTHFTWHFVQDKVHDFAWFCDRHFKARRETLQLLSGRKVEGWVLARKRPSKESLDYIRQALVHYSKRNGDYPYEHCTVVETALKSGGGMEYPMITNVQSLNRDVIIHEVGHNWFQGMIGSQERDYPWMDEGVNSYFEKQTIKYFSPRKTPNSGRGFNLTEGSEPYLLSLYNTGLYLPPGLHSEKYGSLRYGTSVYGHTPELISYLESYLGRRIFDSCTQAYFNTWSFRHPLPGDMRDVFEKISGKDLGWFFKDLIETNRPVDYGLVRVSRKSPEGQTKVTVRNRSGVNGPLQLALMDGDKAICTLWTDGFSGKKEFTLEGRGSGVRLDPYGTAPEMRRSNDYSRSKGILRTMNPLQIKFVASDFDPLKSRMYIAPVLTAFNRYDGYMPGLMIYNSLFPVKRNAFLFMPMYGVRSKQLTGYAQLRKRMPVHNSILQFVETGVRGARFSYRPDSVERSMYERINPYIEFGLRTRKQPAIAVRTLSLEAIHINTWLPAYGGSPGAGRYAQMAYRFQNLSLMRPLFGFISLEHGGSTAPGAGNDFTRARALYHRSYPYKKKNKVFAYTVYGSALLQADNLHALGNPYRIHIGGQSGRFDYTFAQTMTGRSEGLRAGFNTVLSNVGGMRTTAEPTLSTHWAAGMNLETSIPGPVPVSVYMDGSVVSPERGAALQYFYVGGLNFTSRIFGSESTEIAIPLIMSKNLRDFYDRMGMTSYGYRITFKFNLNFFAPAQLSRQLLNL